MCSTAYAAESWFGSKLTKQPAGTLPDTPSAGNKRQKGIQDHDRHSPEQHCDEEDFSARPENKGQEDPEAEQDGGSEPPIRHLKSFSDRDHHAVVAGVGAAVEAVVVDADGVDGGEAEAVGAAHHRIALPF